MFLGFNPKPSLAGSQPCSSKGKVSELFQMARRVDQQDLIRRKAMHTVHVINSPPHNRYAFMPGKRPAMEDRREVRSGRGEGNGGGEGEETPPGTQLW